MIEDSRTNPVSGSEGLCDMDRLRLLLDGVILPSPIEVEAEFGCGLTEFGFGLTNWVWMCAI